MVRSGERALVKELFQSRETMGVGDVGVEGLNNKLLNSNVVTQVYGLTQNKIVHQQSLE